MNEESNLSWQGLLEQAVQAHANGNHEVAEKMYRQVLTLMPGQTDAGHNLACLLLSQNPGLGDADPDRVAEALGFLLGALKSQPGNPQYWLSYIEALLLVGQIDEAKQCLELGRESGLAGAPVDQLEIRVTAAWLLQPDLVGIQSLVAEENFFEAQNLLDKELARVGEVPSLCRLAGELALKQGKATAAAGWFQKLADNHSADPKDWHRLALALQQLNQIEPAYRAYLKALKLCSNDKTVLADLGRCLLKAGRFAEAMVWLRMPLLMGTDDWSVWDDFVLLLKKFGLSEDAYLAFIECRQQPCPPREAEARSILSMLEMGLLQAAPSETVPQYFQTTPIPERQKQEIDRLVREVKYKPLGELAHSLCEAYPFDALGWKVLGVMLKAQGGDLEQSLTALQLCVAIANDDTENQLNLSILMDELKRHKAAELACLRAIELSPNSAKAYFFLGRSLVRQGKSVEGVEAFEKCLLINPKFNSARSAIQFAQHYSESNTPQKTLARAKEFAKVIEAPKRDRYVNWLIDCVPDKIKVGFVSGDLRTHPVGYFTEGFFRSLACLSVEIYIYSTLGQEDDLSARIKQSIKKWVVVEHMTDQEMACLIRQDGIHILIDLSGHTAYNRLPVFTRKPAPVQASWLGYFATTGLRQMDYFIADKYTLPAGEETRFVENLWRLPETFCCMEYVDCGLGPEEEIPVSGLPYFENGYLTFGSFNKLSKMSHSAFLAWVNILLSVENSRILLKAPELIDQSNKIKVKDKFIKAGIAPERIMLYPGDMGREEHMRFYGKIDIALDPFPYSGATTTFDALWMGVPVLACKGDRAWANIGVSIVTNAGLIDWIAEDVDDYISKAKHFAADVDKLAKLRDGMRDRLKASPLFDPERFAMHFEKMLWEMWALKSAEGVETENGKF